MAQQPDYYILQDPPDRASGTDRIKSPPGLTLTPKGHMVLWVCMHCVARSPDVGNLQQHGHPFIGIVIKPGDLAQFAARPDWAAAMVMYLKPCQACGKNEWVDIGLPNADAPESLKDVRVKQCKACGHRQTWRAGLVK